MNRKRFISWPCVLMFLLTFCQTEAGLNISLLHGNAPGEGFVLKDDGLSRGFLCGESWNLQSAEVACRMLGFIGIESSTQRGPISVQVFRDSYICLNGREQTLSECISTTSPVNCSLVVWVLCTNNTVRFNDTDILLRQQGRVELYSETTGWGSLCGNSSDIRDGQVLCRTLDYPGLDSIQKWNYNENWLPITNAGLNCTGTENSIDHCIYKTRDSVTCDKVTHIDCEDAVRLEEGPCDSEGRVQVYQHGSWGPVCDDSFTVADATVVCRMLGLQLVELLNWDVPPSAVSSINATLKNPWCGGNETDIRYCIHEPNATCNKYAAVKCSDPLNVCPADCQDYSSFESLDCSQSQTPEEDTTEGISSTLSPVSTTSSSLVTTLSPSKEEVNRIVNTTITMDNIEVISEELENVTEKSTKFDEELLESVTDKLRSVVGFASEQNLTEDVIVQVSESVIEAVDNILNFPESTFKTTSSQRVSKVILTTISTLTEVIQRTSTNNFTYSGSNIILAALKVDRTSFPLRTAIGGAGNDVIEISTDEGTLSNKADVASVTLPSAILPLVPDDSKAISVSVFLVNSPKLFQGDRPSSSSTSGDKQNQQPKTTSVVASPILTVTIEGTDIKDLPDNESITFVFPVNQSSAEKYNGTNLPARCVYWDITLEEWSDEGCRIDDTTFTDMVTCRCNHLTSFAVLLDIKGSFESQVIDLISRIGCIASIVCLCLTISILLGFRKLRGKRPQQIIVNLCFALLCLYVTFVIGIDRPTWGISCTLVAILLHYFCLASLAWMGVEAFSMYMSFVRVMDTYIPKLLLKCCLVGWGIPFIVVIATVASKWTAYQNSNYCFLLPGPSLYFGLILPIGLILTCNCITFTLVIYKLTCGRKTFSATSTRLSKKERVAKTRIETIRRAQNAVAIGTLLGLTWSFGFLAVGDGRIAFSALFATLNSLQGVFIFLLFGIRQPEVKEKLRATRMRLLQSVRSARRGSDFWTSSSEARMDSRPSDVTTISIGQTTGFTEPVPSMCPERDEVIIVNSGSKNDVL